MKNPPPKKPADRADRDMGKERRNLEEIHRSLFDHPDTETWKATKSLAQPSFLKQIESFGGSHCGPMINSSSKSGQESCLIGLKY